jgi:hypothetical protein
VKTHRKYLAYIVLAAMGSVAFTDARAQVTLSVSPTSADVRATPVLTWSAPTGSVCTASEGWTGSKASSGTQTLLAINETTKFVLSCVTAAGTEKPGTAIVSWTAPTTNSDGTAYLNPGGYRMVWGKSTTSLDQTTYLQDPAVRTWTSPALPYGTWYFGVITFNAAGIESNVSNIASKLVGSPGVPASTVTASATLTIRPAPSPAVITSVVVAGVNYVPVFRVASNGVSISTTVYGLIPTGRECGAKISTWRGKSIHRVVVNKSELWGTTDALNLAAPCGAS